MVTRLLCALADGIRENVLIFSLCDVQWEALGLEACMRTVSV